MLNENIEKKKTKNKKKTKTKTKTPAIFIATKSRMIPQLLNFILITSCNSNKYFKRLENFIGSVHYWEPELSIKVYDLGLNQKDLNTLNELKNVEIVQLNWNEYPSHFKNLRSFAWKPIVMRDALRRFDQHILYQDAGQELRRDLNELRQLMYEKRHFFVVQDGLKTKLQCCGKVAELTHQGTFDYLNVNKKDFENVNMCAGGIQGYALDSKAIASVLEPTVACAMKEECIAPQGASLHNHRFDQSVFSIYLHLNGIQCERQAKFWGNRGNMRTRENIQSITEDETKTNEMILFSRRGWGIDYDTKVGRPYVKYLKRKNDEYMNKQEL